MDEFADSWRWRIGELEDADSVAQRLNKYVVEEPAAAELRRTGVNNVMDECEAEVCYAEGEPEESSASHVIPSERDTETRRDGAYIGDLNMLLGSLASRSLLAGMVSPLDS